MAERKASGDRSGTRTVRGSGDVMSRRLAVAVALLAVLAASGCAQLRPQEEAPAYFTQVTDKGWLYAHNWAGAPCFTMELLGETWRLALSTPEKVDWARGDEFLSIIFTDNRKIGFAVAEMTPEDILRAFLGYEAEHTRPLFDYAVMRQPRFTTEYDGTWMAWGWEGRGGKRRGVKSQVPADQSHVIMSLWLDPYVMSFDWGSKSAMAPREPTLEMIMVLESLEFRPECFGPRLSKRGPPRSKAYEGTDFTDKVGSDVEQGSGFAARKAVPRPTR